MESVISPNISGLQGHKMQKKKSLKTDIHSQSRESWRFWNDMLWVLGKLRTDN